MANPSHPGEGQSSGERNNIMADTNMNVEVKLESAERKEIVKLRQQQRDIKKEIKRLLNKLDQFSLLLVLDF